MWKSMSMYDFPSLRDDVEAHKYEANRFYESAYVKIFGYCRSNGKAILEISYLRVKFLREANMVDVAGAYLMLEKGIEVEEENRKDGKCTCTEEVSMVHNLMKELSK
jgi:hypothetical protein